MTSYMTIMVRVVSNRAQAEFAALRTQQAGLASGIAKTNRMEPLGRRHITSLMKFGNQLQWTGRMIQYNFTLPILLAGGAATKFALDQEKAFKQVSKVYGDTQAAAAQFRREMGLGRKAAEQLAESYEMEELKALDKAFTAISNHYGVQKKEVNEVAAAWAAAGASGLDLAKSVNNTMQAIIIGDMNAMEATKALISIQAQYSLNTEELMTTLANLNSVENQTGASMKDLIIGFEKAAGVARSAGIETQQLAAYMAAIVPAAGSASTGGNALKTIFSRLINPTKETVQVLEAMGIQFKSLEWQSAPVSDQLQIMAEKFEGISKKQKGVVASVAASRWQVNRFDILMREITDSTGYYAKALEAAKDDGESFTRMQKELNTVLESNPRKLQRMMVMLQNASVEIIQPLIPHIIYLAQQLAKAAQAFANLSPETQKLVLFLLLLLAAIGPVVRYMGAFWTLIGVLGHGFVMLFHGITKVVGAAGMLLTPFKMLGTVLMGTLGAISSGLITAAAAVMNVFAAAFIKAAPIVVGSINAIFRSIAGRGLIGAFTLMAGVVATGMKAVGARLLAGFMVMRVYQYAWTVVSLEALRAWLFKMGTIMTLLPSMMIGIMSHVWTLLMIPGGISGTILGMWATLSARISVVWAAGMSVVRGWYAKTLAFLMMGSLQSKVLAVWAAFTGGMVKLWMLMCGKIAKMWAATLAFMMSPAKLMAVLAAVGRTIAAGMLRIIPLLLGPWGLAITAIVGILYVFRDQLAQIWNNIVAYFQQNGGAVASMFDDLGRSIMGVFNKLPEGVQRAMIAVVNVVRAAALAVYEWFSYINPFARHSPSLVDNVTNGMNKVLSEFARLSDIKKYTEAAYAEIKRFGNLTANLNVSAQKQERREDRKVLKDAGAGKALASYNRMTKILGKLNGILKVLEGRMQAQQAVVDKWQAKVDKANDKLDRQQKKLDKLQDKLQKYQDALDAAQQSLSDYASAPLLGMRAMEDQIFANTMAQNRLRLAMMDIEDVVGNYDDLKEKMEAINGLQEVLRGTQADLRAAGAGSEILSQYDREIQKLEEQKGTYTEATSQLNTMKLELEALQREAERLDLVKSLRFDELQRQIEQAADSTKELSFEEIMAGIAGANAEIAKYGPLVDSATAAVEKQQQKVDEATAARDRLQERLDKEQETLDRIKDKYDAVNDAISAIEQTINDVVAAASKMNEELEKKKKKKGEEGYISPGLQNYLDAAGANYPDPGGKGIPPRTDWTSQAADIEKWADELALDTGEMFANINPFKPLKEKAIAAWNWIKDKAANAATAIGDLFSSAFKGVKFGGEGISLEAIQNKVTPILEFLTEFAKDVAKPFKWAYELLWPQVKKIGQGIWDGLKKVWEKVGPKLEEFKELWGPLGDAIKNMWMIVKPILAVLVGTVLAVITGLLGAIGEAIGPAIEAIGTILGGIIDLVKGVVKIIVGIFTVDLGMILSGVGDIFQGLWGLISGIVGGGIRVVWNLVQGFVFGIRDFFLWLWDVLVGHSIVPDIVNGILDTFQLLADLATWVWKNVLKPIYDFFVDAYNDVITQVSGWWGAIQNAWKNIKNNVKDWWLNNVWNPVKNGITEWWTERKQVWAGWWEDIKDKWSNIKNNVRDWWFNSIWNPVKNGITEWWTERKQDFGGWWEDLKDAWKNIKTSIGTWWSTNVTDPIFDKITGVWTRIAGWFDNHPNILKDAVKPVINAVIGAINGMIKGLNKVADILPGISWKIDLIPELAQGGKIPTRRVGNGFVTNGARAIVGEGKANYPEFVIPTDPTHRNRARALVTMAASKIGMGSGVNPRGVAGDTAKDIAGVMRHNGTVGSEGVPQYGIGGWLSDAWGDLKGVAKAVAELPRDAVGGIMDPLLAAGRKKVNSIGWEPAEAPPLYAIDKLEQWVKGTNNVANKSAEKADEIITGGPRIKNALAWAKTQVGKPYVWGSAGPDGYDCSGFMAAITNHIMGRPLHSRLGSTATFPWSGFSLGSKANGFTIGSTFNYGGSGIGHMSGTLAGVNVESAGGVGVRVGSSARGYNDPGYSTRAYLAMKRGGIALARRGTDTPVVLGDGRYDEAVVPLPFGWQSLRGEAGGDRTINIYGNLEFPNIKNGNDAELFLQNLENVSRD